MLCEKYKVNENDITNGIYGHRSLEDLRKEIEKICIKRVENKPLKSA